MTPCFVLILLLCLASVSIKAKLQPTCTFCNLNDTTKSPNQLVDSFLQNEGPFPVVDVFFVIVGLSHYDFVQNSEFWVAINVLRRFATCTWKNGHLLHCDTRIHIITDSFRVVKEIKALGKPFYVYELDMYDEISLPFKALYSRTHNTVNSLDYEFLCFNRWLLMSNITRSWNNLHSHANIHHHTPMTRILSLDLDILMTTNAAKFADGLVNALSNSSMAEPDFDVIVVGLGAINLFSPVGLHRFSTFVFDWFNRSAEVVKAANEHYWKFFSDMMIMKHYIEHAPDNNSRINACFEYWHGDQYYEWRDIPTNQCLLQKLGMFSK